MYDTDRCRQQKLDSTQAVLGFCQSVLPSAVACSHLVVPIHLHSLIITEQVSRFYTPFLPLQLYPGRSFHNSTCVATQKVRLSPNFCRNFVPLVLGFPQAWGNEEKRKSECVCVIHRETQTRESESCVEAHQQRKKPDLLSPKINCRCQLTDSPSAANYRHSRKDLLSSRVCFFIHTYTNTELHWATVYVPAHVFPHILSACTQS